jgi:hypothetical protein
LPIELARVAARSACAVCCLCLHFAALSATPVPALALLFLLALGPGAAPSAAPPLPADTTRPGVAFRPRVAVGAFFSPTRGAGAGVGVGIANLGWTGSDLTLDVRAQQRYQDAGLVLHTADPTAAPLYARLSAHGSTTTRRRYNGVGPFSEADTEVYLHHTGADAELHVGAYPFGTTALLVRPGARVLYDRVRRLAPDSPSPLAALDAASVAAVPAPGEGRHGVSLGVDLLSDRRDAPELPHAGTMASLEVRRFLATDGSDLRFTRVSAGLLGYLPAGPATTLVGRASLLTTRSGDADGDGDADAIPFVYLPHLEDEVAFVFPRDRRHGRDALVLMAGARQTLGRIGGVYDLHALVLGALGNTYDSVWDQAAPAVTFAADAPTRADGRAAFQPALGLGLGVSKRDAQRLSLSGLLGVSPAGFTLATIRMAYDLRETRPVHR